MLNVLRFKSFTKPFPVPPRINSKRQVFIMNCKWIFPFTILIGLVIVFFLFPSEGLAVEYSITNVKIDAYLQENGRVEVKERHTYSFDGDFNGITRELIPKEGSSITKFQAFENGKALRIEKENDLYRVYRKGSDETITVDLTYSIENGIDVYTDVAEFYWPFFDERNESTYEKLSVTIHPPKPTKEVIAFGYDEAFKTENIKSDGSVLFQYGEVPAGENGDIRVAYDAALFPSAPITSNTPMKEEILKSQQELLDETAATAAMQEKLSTIAKIAIPIFAIILFFLILKTFFMARFNRADVERELESYQSPLIPEQTMSLPATILYTNGSFSPAEAMAAALMDLVRKGHVRKTENNHFMIGEPIQKGLKHEQILLKFLFNEVGSNGEFSFKDLSAYTKVKKNHVKYQSNQTEWAKAVNAEIKNQELYKNTNKYRLVIGLSSLVLLPFLILFPIYNLFPWFAGTIVLFFTVIIYACFYKPKTSKGLKISYEWNRVRRMLKDANESVWKSLTEDEKMRSYIYGIGIKDKNIRENNQQFINNFELPIINTDYQHGIYYPADMHTIAYFGPLASTHFHSANQTTRSSGNSSSSSGGGVGGGGGGSGAF